ncbi:MAG: hypothetical protein K2I06_11325, partial [Ruminococcus sp.]|nr:hypothetical protein [Ruminococcus sp.]
CFESVVILIITDFGGFFYFFHRTHVIQITGKEQFRAYGKYCYADIYSVFDYFRLTKEDIHTWLAENPKGTRKSKNCHHDNERSKNV